jgi:L-glyceraldehyde reductase
MSLKRTITLANGALFPQIGLGTWLSKPHEVENAVEIAIRAGYRHLDLARVYRNQDEVGRALKKVVPSVCKREELVGIRSFFLEIERWVRVLTCEW